MYPVIGWQYGGVMGDRMSMRVSRGKDIYLDC